MLDAKIIIDKYINFFEDQDHKRIANSPLVPDNDPTTLFTSAGMQPLIPYLLGETHPSGKRLVNVQDCFRAQDIDEVGDNRHTTFFRMLGNWSLGEYFKKEEIPWLWDYLTRELELPKEKLYITVFAGDENVGFDEESEAIWKEIFEKEGIEPKIYKGDVTKNWWSRSGIPSNMPAGEIGGPDTEVYFRFDDLSHDAQCSGDDPTKCECGKFLEIANSVFIQYQKQADGNFIELPQRNVDFGGGLERLLAAVENKSDIFQTSLFSPLIGEIETQTKKKYSDHLKEMRIIADHLTGSVVISSNGIFPSNKEHGYILRRLIRRAFDNFEKLEGKDIEPLITSIINQRKDTDSILLEKVGEIKKIVLDEIEKYGVARENAIKQINKELEFRGLKMGDKIPADLAFKSSASLGLSPTQLKNLGYNFDEDQFAEEVKKHQEISRAGATQKFSGGLADHEEKTIKGHTATHLLHQALRDVLGNLVLSQETDQ